ncbi:MAG: DUF4838 domain-containing protein [Mariniphaga sp.]|nr:DUF4838 domain-containing protein [Mariniphaga sp.]MDD4226245.1 DUF4838 domain-containing protein [Mariniphaga sp.]MDD4425916.1 DUF4838 domain-containing protein [Mariniphaga sp.]
MNLKIKNQFNFFTTREINLILFLFSIAVGNSTVWGASFQETGTEKNEEYVLFSNSVTTYSIVLPDDASESEIWAANELQHWLTKISGAYFSFSSNHAPKIYIGYCETVSTKTGLPEPAFDDESFRYFNVGPDLFIYGGKQRGTMYGVFSFLENELGCRWYTPTVQVIPEKEEYSFSSLDHSESPGIQVRNDFYYEAFDPVWAARNKMNGRLSADQINQPGGVESYWGVHTFFRLMPPAEFFEEHPEYYSLVDGKRLKKECQLCLSNPEVIQIVTERIKNIMREEPGHMVYSVSQNDGPPYNPCQCKKCQAIVNKYGGKQSGIIIWFVNQIAESIEKEFPDKYIGTLAYRYTRTAPQGISPRENVVVRLCPIEACVAHPLEECPENKSFVQDMHAWSSIAPHLYFWDYVVNFPRYLLPYPNFKVLQPNIKTFRENDGIGIMEQGAYQDRGGEFAELKAYLIAKLLWNPDGNVDETIDDFMLGYYGRSAQYIRQYFDLLQEQITPETHIFINLKADDPIFSEKLVNESLHLLNKARKVADNKEIAKRVELATLPVLFLKCSRTPIVAREDGTFDKFLEIIREQGITRIHEYGAKNDLKSFTEFVLSAK